MARLCAHTLCCLNAIEDLIGLNHRLLQKLLVGQLILLDIRTAYRTPQSLFANEAASIVSRCNHGSYIPNDILIVFATKVDSPVRGIILHFLLSLGCLRRHRHDLLDLAGTRVK